MDGKKHILEHLVEILQWLLQITGQAQWPDGLFEGEGKIGISERQFDVVDAALVDRALEVGHHNRRFRRLVNQAIAGQFLQEHLFIGPLRSKMARKVQTQLNSRCIGRVGKSHHVFRNACEQPIESVADVYETLTIIFHALIKTVIQEKSSIETENSVIYPLKVALTLLHSHIWLSGLISIEWVPWLHGIG